jgi:hypothetical protein
MRYWLANTHETQRYPTMARFSASLKRTKRDLGSDYTSAMPSSSTWAQVDSASENTVPQ